MTAPQRACSVLLLLLAVDGLSAKPPLDVDPADLRPGLAASYRSLTEKAASLDRIDVKPAFHLGRSSPHPRIPAGPFEVVWSGLLSITESAATSFDAYVCGEVTLEVDGVVVMQGRGESETAQVHSREGLKRETGLYPVKIRYRSPPDLPVRLQIWWQSDAFSREPLPAWHLKHLPK